MGNFKNRLENYQVIPRELIFDRNISDRARFVYCFMASKPNGWNFFMQPMADEIGYGIDTLRKYINELVESGWLEKHEQTKIDGKFGAVEYILLDAKKPCTENSDTVNFRNGESSTQYNIDNIEIKDCDNKNRQYLKEDKDKSLSKKVAKNLDLSAVQPHMMNVVETWLAYKKEKKKQYTQKGFDAFYKKIVKLSGNDANKAMQIVDESMSNNWDGIFPLRENFTRKDNFEIGMVLSDDREAIYKDMEENGWMHD